MNYKIYTIILIAIFLVGVSGCKKSDCGSDTDLLSMLMLFSFFDIDTGEDLVFGREAILDPDLFQFLPDDYHINVHSQGYFEIVEMQYQSNTYETFDVIYDNETSLGLIEVYLEEPDGCWRVGDNGENLGMDLYFRGDLVCEDCLRSDIYELKIEKP